MSQSTHNITLAGKEYPVAKLVFRQLRLVIPATIRLLSELGPIIGATQQLSAAAGDSAQILTALKTFNLTEEHFDLMLDAILPTVQRMTPSMTRDALLDMDISMLEMFAAIPVVLEMAGVLKASDNKAPAEGVSASDQPAGEASPPKD